MSERNARRLERVLFARRAGNVFLVLILSILAPGLSADPAVDQFRQTCRSCHTIGGGKLVGPDLKDVSQRKDREWLVNFIVDPGGVFASGDPYALQLKQESNGAVMIATPGMTEDLARALLDLIDAESKLEKSQFRGLSIGDQPFSDADRALGHALFTGTRRLSKGGTSCISCHVAPGIGGLGGGRLGPDLTLAMERLKGRKGLASWLQAPATPAMSRLFAEKNLSDEEIIALVAYLEESMQTPHAPAPRTSVGFVLLGLSGAALGLVGAGTVWKRRFRSVRRALTRGEK